jgi:hypothetical protein
VPAVTKIPRVHSGRTIKLDGYRMLAVKIKGRVTLYSRCKNDFTLVRKTKWSRETLLAETRAIVADYGLAPVQLLHDHRAGHKLLPEDVSRHLTQLVDASLRVFGSTTAVLEEIGFNPLIRRWRRRNPRCKLGLRLLASVKGAPAKCSLPG